LSRYRAGDFVAYAGRWPGEDVPEGEGKYKLPPKFEKSRVLFNLHRLEAGLGHIVLVEGFWSAIRLHSLGVPVVALMGTSISPEQTALINARGVRSVVLLLDGDAAGYQARERLLPLLAETFFARPPLLPRARSLTRSMRTGFESLSRPPDTSRRDR
jgi:DNA primase